MNDLIVTPDQARKIELEGEGLQVVISEHQGDHAGEAAAPQAFLVDMKTAHGTVRPHYHEVDQYQVVVGGEGRFERKHDLCPGLIHYVDGYTPYGPIETGAEGLAFFTLRLSGAEGARWMPESRDNPRPRPGAGYECVMDVSVPVERTQCRLLAATQDGAASFELRAVASDQLPTPPAEAKDRAGYYIVMAGSLTLNDRLLPPRTSVYHPAGESPLLAVAGPTGAAVAFVCFADQTLPRTRGRQAGSTQALPA